MPGVPNALEFGVTSGNQTITKQTETIIATSSPVAQDTPGRGFIIQAFCDTAVDASATTLKVRVRRNTVTGTLVGKATGWTGTAGTMSNDQFQAIVYDQPGEFNGGVYVLTILDVAAASNFVVAYASILVVNF